jgi:hypothetical protein
MAGEATPIIFRASLRSRLVALAIGCALLVVGIAMIGDDSGSSLGRGLTHLRAPAVGWPVAGLGAIVVLAGLIALRRGCPSLELHADGIVYHRCLQGVTRIPWSELDRAEIKRTSAPSSSGEDIKLDGVILVTTSGRRIWIAPVGPPAEVQAALMRMAAQHRPGRRPA